jgi:hypothetical protein
MWLPIIGGNWSAWFRVGDVVAFEATVGPYIKCNDDAPIWHCPK